jgi:maltooligosyltrehalose trehalohydrolase
MTQPLRPSTGPLLPPLAEPAKAPAPRPVARRLPVGAEPSPRGTHFRVWAPDARRLELVVDDLPPRPLAREPGGYWSLFDDGCAPGDLYRFRIDGEGPFADPASRFQPEGPEGPSQVVDPGDFPWSDGGWSLAGPAGQVLYELHVGTFTAGGTWESAMAELPHLADLGVTLIEVMPVAEFAGRFGWGYDGVLPFAPFHHYGEPHDFRAFVDRAHRLGLGVVLDVVYNHLGPRGNVLPRFSARYLSRRHATDWGDALNFDEDGSAAVREYVLANVRHWIAEYHLDGLRLDATQDLHDESDEHVIAAAGRAAREAAAPRRVMLVAENEPQEARLVRPAEQGGHGLDALWNDDFHHSAMVAATGRTEAYYSCHRGTAQELVSAAKHGFLYQGQWYGWQGQGRGTAASDLEPWRFVCYLQNHDQVANSGRGQRGHLVAAPGVWRALTALLLLGPGTPLLFQGQEWGASTPFCYFADHPGELGAAVRRGRLDFLRQFSSLDTPEGRRMVAAACDGDSFAASRLDHGEHREGSPLLALHRDLLRLRRGDAVFSGPRRGGVDGAVLDDRAFVLRFSGEAGERLLLVNLGADLHWNPLPEPLLAPPRGGGSWRPRLSTEDPRYGGCGTPPVFGEEGLHLLGGSAVAMAPDEDGGEEEDRG